MTSLSLSLHIPDIGTRCPIRLLCKAVMQTLGPLRWVSSDGHMMVTAVTHCLSSCIRQRSWNRLEMLFGLTNYSQISLQFHEPPSSAFSHRGLQNSLYTEHLDVIPSHPCPPPNTLSGHSLRPVRLTSSTCPGSLRGGHVLDLFPFLDPTAVLSQTTLSGPPPHWPSHPHHSAARETVSPPT